MSYLTTNEVRNLALELHKGQFYGKPGVETAGNSLPFSFHILSVEQVALRYSLSETVRQACLLHDSLEDVEGLTQTMLAGSGVDPNVIELVWAVTDGKEGNRKTRHAEAYRKIANLKEQSSEPHLESSLYVQALYVKLCDRIANMEHSVVTRNVKIMQMYKKEHDSFVEGLGLHMNSMHPTIERVKQLMDFEVK